MTSPDISQEAAARASAPLVFAERLSWGPVGGDLVLEGFDLSLQAGGATTIIGPNGAGKTTVLRLLAGLVPTKSGRIVRAPGLKIGFAPQALALDRSLPLTVARFLSLWPDVDAKEARAALELFNIAALARRSVHTLSGGQWRRVLLARAIACRPTLLMLDEPLAGVDIAGQAEVYAVLDQWRARTGGAILMVSHDLHVVMARSDHVICLNRTVHCAGPPEEIGDNPHFQRLFGAEAGSFALYRHRPHGQGAAPGGKTR